MCMIYEQCNYSILLLLYDFEMENVEIKQTWTNLKLFLSDVAYRKYCIQPTPTLGKQVMCEWEEYSQTKWLICEERTIMYLIEITCNQNKKKTWRNYMTLYNE